jgi:anti-sigma factor RsiW
MSDPSSVNRDPEPPENLVAYLDGELSSSERQRLELRLARDPRCRLELTQLERTGNLLDELPRAAPDDTFTRSTVEMVALRAAQDQRSEGRARTLGPAAWGFGLAAAAAVGFLAVWLWPSDNERLLVDLPVIQELDALQQAGSYEFLELLVQRRVFEETSDAP